jgi:hypothetical protein
MHCKDGTGAGQIMSAVIAELCASSVWRSTLLASYGHVFPNKQTTVTHAVES